MPTHWSSVVYPSYKTKYKVQNWSNYERGLHRRSDVTTSYSEEALET